MNKFLSSFLTFKGDKVNMNLLEMLMYGMIPGFGQLLMRVDKFGGSLDKPYLLFPLLLFPPFSFTSVRIPPLFFYFTVRIIALSFLLAFCISRCNIPVKTLFQLFAHSKPSSAKRCFVCDCDFGGESPLNNSNC